MSRSSPKSHTPSHRLERVGELIRHALAEALTRGDVPDAALDRHPVTIPAVRMSPDLKLATISVMPLGGEGANATIDALNRHKKELRTLVAHKVNLKFAPDLRFTLEFELRRPGADRCAFAFARGCARPASRRGRRRKRAMIADAENKPAAREREGRSQRGRAPQKRSTRVEVNGWINLDKPVGVTSTQAVGRLKFLFNAKKAGHAGTLDPLASGVLPVAFGEATKTVPIVQEGAKEYRFRVRWGEETATDDAEGEVVARSEKRPEPSDIAALLPRFTGLIEQAPPMFSAIKIDGARAYDLAREGETFEIATRPIQVYRLDLVAVEPDGATFAAECGKGAYVRSLARDIGRALGCHGHVIELRRVRVGPFSAANGIPLNSLPDDADLMARAMRPLQEGLAELPMLAVDYNGAGVLRRGQALLLRGAPAEEGLAWVSCFGAPVAFGAVQEGYFVSTRVFNLPAGSGR